jgi:uncharacterized protein (DUF934 family)
LSNPQEVNTVCADSATSLPRGEEFRIKYDGDGLIDAKDLAESLLALTSLLERSNEIVNGEGSEIAVKIKADTEPGAFLENVVTKAGAR